MVAQLLVVCSYGALVAATLMLSAIFSYYAWRKDRVEPIHKPVARSETVTVVLPISGHYDEQRQFVTWDSMLNQEYAGDVEFIFVAESVDDPAYQHLMNYAIARGYGDPRQPQSVSENHQFRLIISGVSYHNAQKIHNMLDGVNKATLQPKYIVFLDDDISINPLTLQNLVLPLTTDTQVKITTGYSVEVPVSTGLTNYMVMIYRAFNLLGFITESVNYCWGGCFCLSHADFTNSRISDIYLDGGYSDDMTIGNLFKSLGYRIYSSQQNMFINSISLHNFARQYYNYVQRQYFVLTTYYCTKDRIVNAIALAQLMFAGIAVICIATIICSDLAVCLFSGQYQRLQTRAALIVTCMYTIGYSINRAISSLERLVYRMTRQNKQPQRLSCLLTSFSLVLHFALTPIMIIQVMLRRNIQWGPNKYYIRRGRVYQMNKSGKGGMSKKDSLVRYFEQNGRYYDLKQVQ